MPTPGNGAVYEVHQDYLGSVVAVVDAVSGTVVSEYSYDSFGQRTVISEAVDSGYGYTGHQYDAQTGLGYFRMRYYDPQEGRFLMTDPLGFRDGVRNAYAYVANAPYQFVDPTGLSSSIAFKQHSDDAGTNDIFADAVQGAVYGWGVRAILDGLNQALSYVGSTGPIDVFGDAGNYEDYVEGFMRICIPDNSNRIGGPGAKGVRRHGGAAHTASIRARHFDLVIFRAGIRLLKIGSPPNDRNFRMNQDQQNAGGVTVSHCRPDIQYTYFNGGARMLEEFMHSAGSAQTAAKAVVMLHADPDASYLGFRVPYRARSLRTRR